MDDFTTYLKKQITNLVKRGESPQLFYSTLNLSKISHKKLAPKNNQKPQPFWEEYRRQKISQSFSKLSQKSRESLKFTKKPENGNPLLLKKMLMQQAIRDKQLAQEMNSAKVIFPVSENDTKSGRESKRSRRSTIYEKVSEPFPMPRQISGHSDNYLQAKRSFSKKQATSKVKFNIQKV